MDALLACGAHHHLEFKLVEGNYLLAQSDDGKGDGRVGIGRVLPWMGGVGDEGLERSVIFPIH